MRLSTHEGTVHTHEGATEGWSSTQMLAQCQSWIERGLRDTSSILHANEAITRLQAYLTEPDSKSDRFRIQELAPQVGEDACSGAYIS